jgi:sulfofructose kinase
MKTVGGEALNAAVTMAILGARVRFIGCFAADGHCADQREILEQSGCCLEGSVSVSGVSDHFAVILVEPDSGERSIVSYKDRRLSPTLDQLPAEIIGSARAFYSDGREPELTAHGLQFARDLGVQTFLDAEAADEVSELLALVDELIVPIHVVTSLGRRTDPLTAAERVLAAGPRVVVVTMGAAGSLVVSREGERCHVPSMPATMVDTTGAGDAFHGAYVHERLRGQSASSSARLGARAAAIACEYLGPRAPADRLRLIRDEQISRVSGLEFGESI